MDFRNKYLKYKPEITFDIFQKVWDKLISFGYRPFNDSSSIKRYNEFKNSYCFLNTIKDHPMEFSCYFGVADYFSETTVQEILGYDPFVKDDDFVLPENWCIKIPKFKDAPKEIIEWRVGVKKRGTWSTAGYLDNSGWHSDNIIDGYTEISFDQFKKYVLKQNVEKGKEVIPEYVELLDGFDNTCTGEIFDTNQPIPRRSGWRSQWTWESIFKNNIQRTYFKPSTKEAFYAQNQSKQLSEQTANNISETIDRVRYRAMQTAKTETSDEMFCASIDEVSKSLDNYTSELPTHVKTISGFYAPFYKNKIQISTDNEIKINIIQKQSIKI